MNFQSVIPPIQPQSSAPTPSPMIYVTEGPAWEYKQLVRDRSTDKLPTDAELNTLGHKGWELVAVVNQKTGVTFYFKRLK